MATNNFRELARKKYYATERLPEIRQELLRLRTESEGLKAKLTAGAGKKGGDAKGATDRKAIAAARQRGIYLTTRTARLKEEHASLKADFEAVKTKLNALRLERGKATAEAK